MADWSAEGHIMEVKYLPTCILIFFDEYRRGYTKPNGEVVKPSIWSWKCIFSGNESKRIYITKYFNRGDYVKIKGEIAPFSVENKEVVEGNSVYVQTINKIAYPRKMLKQEIRMIKESQRNSDEEPNLEAYNGDDF